MSKRILPKYLVNIPLTILVLIYLVLEELVWERIAEPIYRFIHGLKLLQRLEVRILELNRYSLLVIFLILFAGVEGLGVVSVALFAQGQVIPAVALYAGKIPVTVFTFWLFRIARDKLLTFTWFKFCYDILLTVLDKIKTSEVYVAVKVRLHAVKLRIKAFFNSEAARRIKSMLGFKANLGKAFFRALPS